MVTYIRDTYIVKSWPSTYDKKYVKIYFIIIHELSSNKICYRITIYDVDKGNANNSREEVS